MNANNITIALIGLSDIERKRLDVAFLYSQSRQTMYTAVNITGVPQVLLVDADEPASLIKWRKYRDTLEAAGDVEPPSVLISRHRTFKTRHYQIRYPFIISRVISTLDRLAAKELNLNKDIAVLGQLQAVSSLKHIHTERIDEDNIKRVAALVVDDSLPVRIQMSQALKPFTDHVDFAESGEEALELIKTNEYQLIFLDVVLPGMDGYEICKTIRKGKAKDTPVIMLTSNSSPADKIKGRLAGCDTYLIKPVGETVFKEIVLQYLNMPAKVKTMSIQG